MRTETPDSERIGFPSFSWESFDGNIEDETAKSLPGCKAALGPSFDLLKLQLLELFSQPLKQLPAFFFCLLFSMVCSPGRWVPDIEKKGIRVHTISMTRSVTPFHDLLSFWRLIRYFQKEKFTIVHTYTPKAGLLGSWAAAITRVPIIIHSNLGFYFHEHTPWLKKQFFVWIERFTTLFADIIFSVDKEDIATAREKHIGNPKAHRYLGGWVDLKRFNPERFSLSFVEQKKKESPQKYKGILRLLQEKYKVLTLLFLVLSVD